MTRDECLYSIKVKKSMYIKVREVPSAFNVSEAQYLFQYYDPAAFRDEDPRFLGFVILFEVFSQSIKSDIFAFATSSPLEFAECAGEPLAVYGDVLERDESSMWIQEDRELRNVFKSMVQLSGTLPRLANLIISIYGSNERKGCDVKEFRENCLDSLSLHWDRLQDSGRRDVHVLRGLLGLAPTLEAGTN